MGSEIEAVVEADVAEETEGNTGSATRRDSIPEACAVVPPESLTWGMYGEGGRGTWEVPTLCRKTEPLSERE